MKRALVAAATVFFLVGVAPAALAETGESDDVVANAKWLYADINDFWLATIGDYRPPTEIWVYGDPYGSVQQSCNGGQIVGQNDPNLFYCRADEAIFIHNGLQYDMIHGLDGMGPGEVGDGSEEAVISHEWGHHIQHVQGHSHLFTIGRELQADCYSGLYMHWAEFQSGTADASDRVEAAWDTYNAGDPDGTPWWDSNAHGTSDQRLEAFATGWYYYDFSMCDTGGFIRQIRNGTDTIKPMKLLRGDGFLRMWKSEERRLLRGAMA